MSLLKATRLTLTVSKTQSIYLRPHINSRRRLTTATMSQADISKSNPVDGDGSFKRADAFFRNHVKKGGEFAPEAGTFESCTISSPILISFIGRYHLYVSYACRTHPLCSLENSTLLTFIIAWAHRTLIYRKLKGLEDMIGM